MTYEPNKCAIRVTRVRDSGSFSTRGGTQPKVDRLVASISITFHSIGKVKLLVGLRGIQIDKVLVGY